MEFWTEYVELLTESSLHKKSTNHTSAVFTKDLNKIIEQLMTSQVFTSTPGCFHSNFSNLKNTITAPLHMKKEEFTKWLRNHMLHIDS